MEKYVISVIKLFKVKHNIKDEILASVVQYHDNFYFFFFRLKLNCYNMNSISDCPFTDSTRKRRMMCHPTINLN